MRLFILGTSSDDRGAQLEILTKELLETLGYKHLRMNVANDAGEVDVEGEFIVPMPVEHESIKLIAECKAHKTPLNMTDWLKFLGKVFVAQTKGDKVTACLVALSGVNGNVLGSYESMQGKGIRLVESTTLNEYLAKSHALASAERIRDVLDSAGRTYLTIDLAYYQRKIYCVVGYEGGEYTILDADASFPNEATLNPLRPMVETVLETGKFIDLREEEKVRRANLLARKIVISEVMLGDGQTSEKNILVGLPSYPLDVEISNDQIRQAISALLNEGLLVAIEDGRVAFPPIIKTDAELRRRVFLVFCEKTFLILPVGCEWWDRHIDQSLVIHACSVQAGLKLGPDSLNKVELLMRLSPRGLLYSLLPDPMIVAHRIAGRIDDDLEKEDQKHFMRSMYDSFNRDFRTVELSKYFHAKRRIEAVDVKSEITVYDRDDGIVVSGEVQDTHMIGEWHEKAAEGSTIYVHIAAVSDFALRRRSARLDQPESKAKIVEK